MMRIAPLAFGILAAAGCAAGQQQPAHLPPACPPDVAARILANRSATIITPPAMSALPIPPERPGSGVASTYRLTLTIDVDGHVVRGSVRVAGLDHPAYTRRLVRWAEDLRFRPATAEGCAIRQDMELVFQT